MSGTTWRMPYPLRATRITIDFMPFGFWWRPRFQRTLASETQLENGGDVWRVRWGWFQISYGRWV